MQNGAAVTVAQGASTLQGCQIRDNRAIVNGGGIYVKSGISLHIVATTVAENTAQNYGGGQSGPGNLVLRAHWRN